MGKFSFSDSAWSNSSDKAKDFITKLLTYDPEKRPSAEQTLQHPWIIEMSQSTINTSVAHDALLNLKTFRAD